MAKFYSGIDTSVGIGTETLDSMLTNGSAYGISPSQDIDCQDLSVTNINATGINTVSGFLHAIGGIKDTSGDMGSSGQVLSSTGSGLNWINSSDANVANASNVGTNDASSTNSTHYLTFVGATSGNNPLRVDTSLQYNPSINQLKFNDAGSLLIKQSDETDYNWTKGIQIGHDTGGPSPILMFAYNNNGYISDRGNELRITSDSSPIRIRTLNYGNDPETGDDIATFNPGHSVDLFYTGTKRFSTSGVGATTFGNLDVTGSISGTNYLISSSNFSLTGGTINGDLDVDGHTNLDNVSIAGVVTATSFVGDGSQLTGTSGAGFVNAADYGLDASKTDGTNVTAINNAIAALGSNGGTIFFPGGMFYLNAAIELTQAANENSLRFVGSGHQNYGGGSDTGGTVLRRDADDEFFNITNSRAIHFVGITFKGGAANGNGGDSGISGGNGAIYVVANAGCQGYLIENCVFHGIANSIHFKGLSDSIIRACRFRNVPSNEGAGACIKLDENGSEVIDQIRIEDCVLDGSPDGTALNANVDGIAIYNTVSTVYVTNTSAIRLKRSFYSDSSWDGNFFYFQNSEAERASSDGFSINGTGNFVTIDNCFSCTNGGHGINILSNQNSSVNITNPNVRDNVGHGILIDANSINNCSIVNPAIGGNSRGSTGTNHGIVIGTNANNVYISGGKIGGNTDELSGQGDQGRGIQINGNTHTNIRIIGTNVTGNQNAEGISQNITGGSSTGNSIQFNAGSTVALDT